MINSELKHIDWHDSKVESICLFLNGIVSITFKSICSFHEYESGKVETWLSRAELHIMGVTNLSVPNLIEEGLCDGELIDVAGDEVELLPIGKEKSISHFKLYAGSTGACIKIVGTTAKINKIEHIQYLQDFEQ